MQNASQKGFSVFGIRTLTPFESAIGLSSAVAPLLHPFRLDKWLPLS
jgi:hypothetical protein